MLGHYSQMTGQPKLQIFSKALEESYQTALLNGMKLDYFSMRWLSSILAAVLIMKFVSPIIVLEII